MKTVLHHNQNQPFPAALQKHEIVFTARRLF